MTLVDWVIVIILAAAVLGGMMQGFFRSVCSLGGLILGLVLAAWNYKKAAAIFLPLVKIPAVANTIGFLLIALVVMALIGLIGKSAGKNISPSRSRMAGWTCRRGLSVSFRECCSSYSASW